MNRRIRILHITQAVGGGVERYIQMLLKYLDHTTYENCLMISDEADICVYEGLADSIEQIDMRRAIGLHDVRSVVKARKVFRRLQPDIIYAHSSKAGAIARLANLGLGNVCIYNPHGWAFNMIGSVRKQKVYAILERILAPISDRIICISNTEKMTALKNNICGADKLTVINNGIEIMEYSDRKCSDISRELLRIPEKAFVIGMVGRIVKQKAPDIFVKMAQNVMEKIPEAFFLIVGDGEMREQIEEQIESAGMQDRFHITGWVDNPKDYMSLFDVAVLLSRWEGFGLVLPEYMLSHKPIVAASVDAIPELIQDRHNGLLVPMNDAQAASDAVCELHRDAQLREKLVAQGMLDVYEKYDVRRVAEEHMRLFRQVKKRARKVNLK